jgi:hypothetical protein
MRHVPAIIAARAHHDTVAGIADETKLAPRTVSFIMCMARANGIEIPGFSNGRKAAKRNEDGETIAECVRCGCGLVVMSKNMAAHQAECSERPVCGEWTCMECEIPVAQADWREHVEEEHDACPEDDDDVEAWFYERRANGPS